MSCDVIERARLLFPRLRTENESRAPEAKFLYGKGVVTWMRGYAAGITRFAWEYF